MSISLFTYFLATASHCSPFRGRPSVYGKRGWVSSAKWRVGVCNVLAQRSLALTCSPLHPNRGDVPSGAALKITPRRKTETEADPPPLTPSRRLRLAEPDSESGHDHDHDHDGHGAAGPGPGESHRDGSPGPPGRLTPFNGWGLIEPELPPVLRVRVCVGLRP
eukprot:3603043-Rhodomonas_salina.2